MQSLLFRVIIVSLLLRRNNYSKSYKINQKNRKKRSAVLKMTAER